MSTEELSPEQEAEALRLAELIGEATREDLVRVARLLVSRQEADLFGRAEFAIRDILLRAGAQAYQTFLAQKKTATGGPR
jgi:hypothetical protein